MTRRRTHTKYKANNDLFIVLAVVCLAVMIALVTGSAVQSHGDKETNPTIRINNWIEKVCDGKNLIYFSKNKSMQVVPDSPQCKG